MKISASIYSDSRPVEEIVRLLDEYSVDYFHIDCNDNPDVFKDIEVIRKISKTPIDLHIISPNPDKFTPLIEQYRPDLLCYQFEDLPANFKIPSVEGIKKGIAITTPTPIEQFEKYDDQCDFLLIMATTPGKSGGEFNKENFSKIRLFKKNYPEKMLHVDGGVNAETSFILRNLGVTLAVSGSFLIKNKSKAAAILDLKLHSSGSHYLISDFMIPLNEAPHQYIENTSIPAILLSIEEGKLGVTLIIDKDHQLKGIVSNADIRKALIREFEYRTSMTIDAVINPHPLTVYDTMNVHEMLEIIRKYRFPISYLPVINKQGKAVGLVHFLNLIKGEL